MDLLYRIVIALSRSRDQDRASVCHATTRALGIWVEVDAIEQVVEHALFDEHRGRTLGRQRQPERAPVEALCGGRRYAEPFGRPRVGGWEIEEQARATAAASFA
jgi:hypothetical protein